MTRFILVRHGETEWNQQLRCQGQSDAELNDAGIKQAEKLRDRLSNEQIDFIYSSDLRRAIKTAEIIASNHNVAAGVCLSPLLREMDFGDFEGLTFDEMKRRFPHVINDREAWKYRGPDVPALNGESISQVADRIRQFSRRLEKHRANETVLIVAHGGSLLVLMCLLLGIGLEHWWQLRLSNGSISVMETRERGIALVLFNDVCHMAQSSNARNHYWDS